MRLVVLGLSLSSSRGNGHATTFCALLKAFAARGHEVLVRVIVGEGVAVVGGACVGHRLGSGRR